ncbi:hypothetical protein Scep_004760 [Stephania cephalantha]|uniref:Uncharacterized protein n=1 Tax=Stephania cephalantha TaxID=152367 RepID=A0AAP0PZF2_9MAGN
MATSSGNAQSTNDVNVQRRPKRFHSSINDSISDNPRKWISKRKDKMVITQDLESHGLSHTSLLPRGAMSSLNEMLSPISGLDFHSRSQSMFINTPHKNLYHGGSASTGFSLSLEHDPFNFKKSGNFSWLKGNKLEKSHVTNSINVEGLGRSLGFNCQKLYGASFSPFIGLSTFSSGSQVIEATNFSRNDLNIGKNSTASSTSLERMGPLFHVLKDGKLFFDDNPHTSITNDDLKVNSRVSRSSPTRNDKEVMYEENKAFSEFRLDQLHIPASEEFGSYLSMHCINLGSCDLNQQRLLPLVINGSELNDPYQVYPKNFGSPFSLGEHISKPRCFRAFHGISNMGSDKNLKCFGLPNDNRTIMRMGNDIGWNGIENKQYEPNLLSPSICSPPVSSSSALAQEYKENTFSMPQSSWVGFQPDQDTKLSIYGRILNDELMQKETNDVPTNSWENLSYWGPLGEILNVVNEACQAHQNPSLHLVNQIDVGDHDVASGAVVANEIGNSPPVKIVEKASDEALLDDAGDDFVSSIFMNSSPL